MCGVWGGGVVEKCGGFVKDDTRTRGCWRGRRQPQATSSGALCLEVSEEQVALVPLAIRCVCRQRREAEFRLVFPLLKRDDVSARSADIVKVSPLMGLVTWYI